MTDINVNALSEAINDKLDRDMDNLLVESTESKNIANWSNNVTNCITEIPQDIKLELNNGTLTLKAGSKAYYPDGFEQDGTTKKFSTITTSSDIVLTDLPTSTTLDMLFLSTNTMTLAGWPTTIVYSGDTDPLSGDTTTLWACWYDTANNIFKTRENSATWATRHYTLPLGVDIGNSTDAIVSIEQVFNGFGYLGSTIFALPGVKGLIPNGRNSDGTLKSISFTSVNVITSPINDYTLGSIDYVFTGADLIPYDTAHYWYKEEENKNFQNYANTYVYATPICHCSLTSGVVSNFIPKTVYYPVDYSGADFVIAYQRPTSTNNYTWYRKYKSGWVEQGGIITAPSDAAYVNNLPVTMIDTNYIVMITRDVGTDYNSNINGRWQEVYNKTTTSFTTWGIYASKPKVMWQVSGMAAQ